MLNVESVGKRESAIEVNTAEFTSVMSWLLSHGRAASMTSVRTINKTGPFVKALTEPKAEFQ